MYDVVIAIVQETRCLARILDPDYYTSRLPDPTTSTKEEGEKHLSNFFHPDQTTQTKEEEETNLSNFFSVFLSVLRIHDILGWIRNPPIFVIDLQDASKKIIFYTIFSGYYFLKVHLHHFSKIKSQNRRNEGFFYYFA